MRLFRIFLYLALRLSPIACHFHSIAQNEANGGILSEAAVEIITKMYATESATVHIATSRQTGESSSLQGNIMAKILRALGSSIKYAILDARAPTNAKFMYRRIHNLLIIGDYSSFRRILDLIQNASFSRGGFYLLIMTEQVSAKDDTLTRIFNDLWSAQIANVYILCSAQGSTNAQLYTSKLSPRSPANHCDRVHAEAVNRYENGTFVSTLVVFTDKFRNMDSCNVYVSSNMYPPHTKPVTYANGTINIGGIEGAILDDLAAAMNFNVVIRYIAQTSAQSEAMINMVENGTADLAIGGLVDTPDRRRRFAVSFPFVYTSTRFITSIGVPYTPLQKIAMPFSMTVWMWISVMCLVALVCSYLKIGQSFLDVINIITGGVIKHVPRKFHARFILVTWLMSTFILRNAYQGALFDFLQSQIHFQPVDTIDKIIKYNYTVYLNPVMYDMVYESVPKLRNQLRLHGSAGAETYKRLLDHSFHGVYSINRIMEVYYHMLYPEDHQLVSSKEVLINWPKVILFPKHSSLVSPFNRYLEIFTTSGIVQHRINKYYDTKYMNVRQEKSTQILTLSQLAGIFYICGGLYALATILFILELICGRIRWRKRIPALIRKRRQQ